MTAIAIYYNYIIRFQQEELMRMKTKEAQKKREEFLRDKIRIEEEKLQEERDRKAEERRKSKKRSRKSKHKKKDRDSDTETPEKVIKKEEEEEKKETDEEQEALAEETKPGTQKSPDQYELLKMNFLSQQKQALENELR